MTYIDSKQVITLTIFGKVPKLTCCIPPLSGKLHIIYNDNSSVIREKKSACYILIATLRTKLHYSNRKIHILVTTLDCDY